MNYIPSEIIILCLNMVGFVLNSDILLSKEKNVLVEYLRRTIDIQNKICVFQSLYSNKFDNIDDKYQFDAVRLTESVENNCNLLYVIKTEFDHIFCIFTPHCAEKKWGVWERSFDDVFVYLVRSQFKSLECPKEICTHMTYSTNFFCVAEEKYIWKGLHFGGLAIFRKTCILIPTRWISDGNELCGGNKFVGGRGKQRFHIESIEIHQIKQNEAVTKFGIAYS
eukprot:UN05854